MVSTTQYARAKARLLADPAVCAENRALFTEFFTYQEYKLTRQNGLPSLDDGCRKTLYGYLQRFKNVNAWFDNKPWRELTKEDIKRVYDGLEDGTIRSRRGGPFKDRSSYYNKIFKSKPFRMVGKDALAREVIEFAITHKPPVRFVTESTFRRLAAAVHDPRIRTLLWLAWDIGENIGSLLMLTKRHFAVQTNRHTGEREYLLRLDARSLKRSRQARSEITLYPETVSLLDSRLAVLHADERLFTFGYRYATKVLEAAVARSAATTEPLAAPVRWKDLRSGMACHLLRLGWTRDEVNARLGHTPHSAVLDAYINSLALDREGPKARMFRAGSQSTGLPSIANTIETNDARQVLAQLDSLRAQMLRLTTSSTAMSIS